MTDSGKENQKKRTSARSVRNWIPPLFLIGCVFAAVSGILLILCRQDETWADGINHYYGGLIRIASCYLTQLIPFSVAETLLLFSPFLAFLLIRRAWIRGKESICACVRYLLKLVGVIGIVFSLFASSLGFGFSESSIASKLRLQEKKVTAEELAETMTWLIGEANALCSEVDFVYGDRSVSPLTGLLELCTELTDGFHRFRQGCPSFYSFPSVVKPVAISEGMSYTHFTGMYTFFTGEANLNIDFPDYTLPFTAAHEMAHQRGFAREKEANFVAFLVTVSCDSPYIRYSGYVSMVEYFSSALYKADKDLWKETMGKLDARIQGELRSYNAFFAKYKESQAAKVSTSMNDSYLKQQGQPAGSASYGLVVDLTVAYYQQRIQGNR